MRRLTLGLIALSLLPAFAPAPFPRPSRRDHDQISLTWFQGTWDVISNEAITGQNKQPSDWGITHVRVRGGTWTLMDRGREVASYTITVDGTPTPARIDWFPLDRPDERTLWIGIMKREGDR